MFTRCFDMAQCFAGERHALLDKRADFLGLGDGGHDPALDLRLVLLVGRIALG